MPPTAHGELAHVVWLGGSAFFAIAFGLLHLTRRAAREHGALALLALSQVALHLLSVLGVHARDLAEAALVANAYLAVVALVAGAALELVVSFGAAPARERALGWTAAGAAFVAGATGLAVDPSRPSAAWDGSSSTAALAAVTPFGHLAFALVAAGLTMGAVRLVVAARADPLLRVAAAGTVLAVGPTLLDTVYHLYGAADWELVHHARGVVLLVLAAALVQREAANEQALGRKSAEAGASASRLAVAQQELLRTQQLAAVGELSAVIAHEIRNPLAILRNAASSLRREVGEDDRQALLKILDEEVDRLDRLLDDLLVYARPLAPDTQEVELTDLVRQAVRLALEGQPTARNIDIDFDRDERPRPISGDPALLRHALINIVDNAILAMPRGGTISIRFRRQSFRGETPGWAIDVRDEGEGMDTLVRSRAKDPFFTTREAGTGLGLAIVERVARVHGGEVSFESHGVDGTTVTLALPAAVRQSAIDLELQTGRFSTVSRIPDRPSP